MYFLNHLSYHGNIVDSPFNHNTAQPNGENLCSKWANFY